MISVIIPVYNAINYIEDCIGSILEQSFSDWELILVDNGSEDDSLTMCRKWQQKDDRIRVFHEEVNSGVSAARNLGMKQAQGEYLTFVDADDRLKPDCLEQLLKLQTESQADMVIGGFERWRDRNQTVASNYEDPQRAVGKENRQKDNQPIYREYALEAYLESCLLNGNTHCWGVLYKKELLGSVLFPEGMSIGEDVLFLLEAGFRAKRIAVADYCGYLYYINPKGAMERPFTPAYMDQIRCWQQVQKKILPLYPRMVTRLESLLLVSTMLVVGKLAGLPKEELEHYRTEEAECREMARQYGRKKEVCSDLPEGYPMKVWMYRHWPGLYLFLYGRRKKRGSLITPDTSLTN